MERTVKCRKLDMETYPPQSTLRLFLLSGVSVRRNDGQRGRHGTLDQSESDGGVVFSAFAVCDRKRGECRARFLPADCAACAAPGGFQPTHYAGALLPVPVLVHHALADRRQIADFYEALQA
ncbi:MULTISPECIES: hypothetical protein [Caproicibacterium]|uniref:Chloramphenicol acetyltransferase n=1 Tax=Caproicibacterium argilliputei TaxID=3030016 RepID=A0AA97H4E0_9FIRM|nr:hypothetical protein [Caproicibacterium argilliputei]WOC33318.1 hypothetical protein PXC00_05470 [Caproicibacterium argilliputei]